MKIGKMAIKKIIKEVLKNEEIEYKKIQKIERKIMSELKSYTTK